MPTGPVSLTGVACKILEKILRKSHVSHLEDKKCSQKDYGLTKGTSCVTNSLSYHNGIAEIMKKKDEWANNIYLRL